MLRPEGPASLPWPSDMPLPKESKYSLHYESRHGRDFLLLHGQPRGVRPSWPSGFFSSICPVPSSSVSASAPMARHRRYRSRWIRPGPGGLASLLLTISLL
ncbi:hypothetical protein LY76DRAFT_106088 [Colletotrichum caudatum]|nr:hypothetical protein LY76DRAFT_106088 [Colletotrichum caudatum]